jgi:hypothetical protein
VIVNANTREWLDQCLKSLFAQVLDGIEVVVVDNASTDGSIKMLREEYPACELVLSEKNIGFGGGNNLGAQRCTGPRILFLNPDTEVKADSLVDLIAFMEANPQWGIVGGKIYDGDGELERSSGKWPTFFSLLLDRVLDCWRGGAAILERWAHHHRNHESSREVSWVTGAYLCIDRALFEQLGGFESDIFMYYEDVDLCYRSRRAGAAIYFFSGASIIHYRNKAPVADKSRKSLMRQGMHGFVQRNYSIWRFPTTRFLLWLSLRVSSLP